MTHSNKTDNNNENTGSVKLRSYFVTSLPLYVSPSAFSLPFEISNPYFVCMCILTACPSGLLIQWPYKGFHLLLSYLAQYLDQCHWEAVPRPTNVRTERSCRHLFTSSRRMHSTTGHQMDVFVSRLSAAVEMF